MSDGAGVPASQVADLLEITVRRVQQLAQEGVFPKSGRDSYPMVACVRAYVGYWRDRAEGRQATGLDAERKRERAAKAEMAELDLAERKGELIRAGVHREVLMDVFQEVRSSLLNLPVVVSPELVGLDSERAVVAILQPAVENCLSGLVAKADEVERRALEARPADA